MTFSLSILMRTSLKTNAYRTKRKVRNESNANEADKLIEDYIDENLTYNQKTRRILEEYLDNKDDTSKT